MINNNLSIGIALFSDDRSANFAIQSAMAQSDNCNEIIISDNNAGRSSNLIDDWRKDSRVKYINCYSNIGMYKNFVRAYDNSKNRYFCWLSDDDFLHPMMTDVILLAIGKNQDENVVAWSGIPTVHSTKHCSLISGRIHPSFSSYKRIQRLRDVAYFGQWNYPFYSIIDKNKVSIETLRKFCNWPAAIDGMDWAWTYSLALRGKIHVIPEQMYFYDISNWQNESSSINQDIEFIKIIRDEFRANKRTIDDLTRLNRWLLYMSYTFSDYIDFIDGNNAYFNISDVNDLIKLWCIDIVSKLILVYPKRISILESYENFIKSRDVKSFMINLAHFYDEFLIEPSMQNFILSIFSSESCNDKKQILTTIINKPEIKNFSIKNIQTNSLHKYKYILDSLMRGKIVLLPRIKE